MPSEIEIRTAARLPYRVPRRALTLAAERALAAEHVRAPLTLYITGNAEIRRLNRAFHAVKAATDVLAFPAHPHPVHPPRSGHTTPRRGRDADENYLGDVVISYEQARAQAQGAGWPVVRELELLVVHGILHLLGYDDVKPQARKKMWARQAQILGRPIPPVEWVGPEHKTRSTRSRDEL